MLINVTSGELALVCIIQKKEIFKNYPCAALCLSCYYILKQLSVKDIQQGHTLGYRTGFPQKKVDIQTVNVLKMNQSLEKKNMNDIEEKEKILFSLTLTPLRLIC